jgi:hypothetical protein
MQRAFLLLAIFLAAACSHGRAPNAPPAAGLAGAGQVAVVRNDNLFDWWVSVKVSFNDRVIAHIRAGEHLVFQAPAGLHTVGVADRGISVVIEPNRMYYFLISADTSQAGFEIERLDPRRGEEWLAKTKPIP